MRVFSSLQQGGSESYLAVALNKYCRDAFYKLHAEYEIKMPLDSAVFIRPYIAKARAPFGGLLTLRGCRLMFIRADNWRRRLQSL